MTQATMPSAPLMRGRHKFHLGEHKRRNALIALAIILVLALLAFGMVRWFGGDDGVSRTASVEESGIVTGAGTGTAPSATAQATATAPQDIGQAPSGGSAATGSDGQGTVNSGTDSGTDSGTGSNTGGATTPAATNPDAATGSDGGSTNVPGEQTRPDPAPAGNTSGGSGGLLDANIGLLNGANQGDSLASVSALLGSSGTASGTEMVNGVQATVYVFKAPLLDLSVKGSFVDGKLVTKLTIL